MAQLTNYRIPKGYLNYFDEVVSRLHRNASANQFEQSLDELGRILGFSSERHDEHGKGPDVLWLLPNKVGLVIEAKSCRLQKNSLTKDNHGQLLIAGEWFLKNYPDYTCIRVSVHPNRLATEAAVAGASYALTYEKLATLTSDAREILTALIESQLSGDALVTVCADLLAKSPLKHETFVQEYLQPFQEI